MSTLFERTRRSFFRALTPTPFLVRFPIANPSERLVMFAMTLEFVWSAFAILCALLNVHWGVHLFEEGFTSNVSGWIGIEGDVPPGVMLFSIAFALFKLSRVNFLFDDGSEQQSGKSSRGKRAGAQPRSGFPLGLDYAGGRPSGASLAAAGVRFVCRYVTDGGWDLPQKLLVASEVADLQAHGIQIVSNFESSGRMDGGFAQGAADARTALANHYAAGGAPNPVIYFSCDYDAPESDQGVINDYLAGAGSILGGPQFVGIYAGYWVVMRALNAGVCRFAWQTEAWSGGNVDARINILQRNSVGYMFVDGVECDYDESRTDYFGQWGPASANVATAPRVWHVRPYTKESCNSGATSSRSTADPLLR